MSKTIQESSNKIIRLSGIYETETIKRRKLSHLNLILEEIEKIEKEVNPKKSQINIIQQKHLLKELKISEHQLKQSLKKKERKSIHINTYAKITNLFFEPISEKILQSFPFFGTNIHKTLLASGIKLISISYISISLFTSFLLLFLGTVLGAFLLGIVENFGIWYLPSGYKDAIAFVLLFIFLLFRPQGILGIKRRAEK